MNFSNGTFYFPSLNFGNGVSANFTNAVVILNGENLTGTNIVLSTGTNATGNQITSSNSLLYIAYGNVVFLNNNGGDFSWNPTLPPYPTSPPSASNYFDVTIWNAGTTATNGGNISIANNATGTYGGLYAPDGAITDSQNGSATAYFLTASQVTITNGAQVALISP